MCVLSIKVPIRKKSGNLFNRIYYPGKLEVKYHDTHKRWTFFSANAIIGGLRILFNPFALKSQNRENPTKNDECFYLMATAAK